MLSVREEDYVVFEFARAEDRVRFENVAAALTVLLAVYVSCSGVTFCSSGMLRVASNLYAVRVMVDLVTIDVTSSASVVAGFLCAHVYVASEMAAAVYHRLFLFFLIDMWFATVLSCFVGGLYAVATGTFRWPDLALTLFEGVTSVRVLDFQQSAAAPHSLNTFAWLVMCMFVPAAMLPGTLRVARGVNEAFGELGVYVVLVLCGTGVLMFSVFALIQDDSNVFYGNATGLGYRMLEVNLGINAYYLLTETGAGMLTDFLTRLKIVILTVFAFAWWSELGAPAEVSDGVCVRLYHFNPCIRDPPGVLLRWCLLGLSVVVWVFHETPVSLWLTEPVQAAMNAVSTVLLCCPVFTATKGMLELTFGSAIVNRNAALLSLIMPVTAFSVVWAYNMHMKVVLQRDVCGLVCDCTARVRAAWRQPTEQSALPDLPPFAPPSGEGATQTAGQ